MKKPAKKVRAVKVSPKKIANAVARTLMRVHGWGATDANTRQDIAANFACWEVNALASWFIGPIRQAITPKPKRRAKQ